MSKLNKAVKAIAAALGGNVRELANPTAAPEVAKAIFSGTLKAPEWLTAMTSEDEAVQAEFFLAAGFGPKVKVISQGGSWDGAGSYTIAKIWAAPGSKGAPVFATDERGLFAWAGIRPDSADSAKSKAGSSFHELDPETGLRGIEFPLEVGGSTIKLKPKDGPSGFGVDYMSAVHSFLQWIAGGDGHRQDLIIISQLVGDHRVTANDFQDIVQGVSSWIVLGVPRVAPGRGSFADLVAGAANVRPAHTATAVAERAARNSKAREGNLTMGGTTYGVQPIDGI